VTDLLRRIEGLKRLERAVRAAHPGAREVAVRVYEVTGDDTLRSLPRWRAEYAVDGVITARSGATPDEALRRLAGAT
jgi:hypothetical protein